MTRRASLMVAALFVIANAALTSAADFVYVAVPAPACSVAPCAPPEVVVIDGDTGGRVIGLPLPVGTMPVGIAMSRDGAHLYVSNFDGTTGSLTVIDARRHVVLASYPTGQSVAGPLAIRGDDSRVFIRHSDPILGGLSAFDTASHTIVDSTATAPGSISIAASSSLDRVFVLFGAWRGVTPIEVRAYDAATLDDLGAGALPPFRNPTGMSLSRDESRLHVLLDVMQGFNPSTSAGARVVLDPATLATTGALQTAPGAQASSDPIESTATGRLLAVGRNLMVLRSFPLASESMSSVALSGEGLAVAVGSGDTRAYVTTRPHPQAGGTNALATVNLSTMSVVRTTPLGASALHLTTTPPGAQACSYRLDAAYRSFSSAGGTASLRLTTTCAWDARSNASWVRVGTTSGASGGTIGITVDPWMPPPTGPYATRSATVSIGGQLVTITQAGAESQPPFGFVDTPGDGATGVTGSLAVTGWALDDVGVARVRVYRDAVAGESPGLRFIGNASFVEGARPDLQALFPLIPFAPRAGWGLMVLTNMLPNGGTGTYRLWVYAEDIEGRQSLLGVRTFTAANGTADVPFGAIDTPGSGEEVSGVIVNWGWALTPSPGAIPTDGSTIDVVVDGAVVGQPTYNLFRPDIAALFPGYANTNGAVGYFVLDTRTLTNGIHSISWVVRDDLGRARGIGSRYINVQNP